MEWGILIATAVTVVGGIAWFAITHPKAYNIIVWPTVKWLYLIAFGIALMFIGASIMIDSLQSILDEEQQRQAREIFMNHVGMIFPLAAVWFLLTFSMMLFTFLARAVESSGDRHQP